MTFNPEILRRYSRNPSVGSGGVRIMSAPGVDVIAVGM
jgi:hypothetical protein